MSAPDAPASPGAAAEWKPTANPWIITAAVMLATFMEVLDTTIVSVALPHIAGSLSATTDEATWVLTSYLVSNAIALPASAWFARYFGRKRFLIACIIIFTISSFICGIAADLPILIIARVLQGAGGGALQPLSQAILMESFPPEKRGMAMAAFAVGVVVAPILGPTLGGWLTDQYSWRWAFYINIPIGVLAVIMTNLFIEDPPYIKYAKPGRIDALGFGLMGVALAVLQIVLDRGEQVDWFAAPWMRWAALLCLCSFVAFIVRELTVAEPIVNLRVFSNRNFMVGSVLIFMVGTVLYSALTILPLFLQTLMGYPALQSGLAVSPRGIGSLFTMPFIGFLTGKVDVRKLIGTGFTVLGVSLWMIAGINLDISVWSIVWPSILTGSGLSMIFVPLSTVTMGTLKQEEMGNGSGIFNLMRNVGGSVGIAAVTALLSRQAQVNQADLLGRMHPGDPAFGTALRGLQGYLQLHRPGGPADAMRGAQGMLYGELQRQAAQVTYVNNFRLLAILSFACILGVFLLKRVKAKGPVSAH